MPRSPRDRLLPSILNRAVHGAATLAVVATALASCTGATVGSAALDRAVRRTTSSAEVHIVRSFNGEVRETIDFERPDRYRSIADYPFDDVGSSPNTITIGPEEPEQTTSVIIGRTWWSYFFQSTPSGYLSGLRRCELDDSAFGKGLTFSNLQQMTAVAQAVSAVRSGSKTRFSFTVALPKEVAPKDATVSVSITTRNGRVIEMRTRARLERQHKKPRRGVIVERFTYEVENPIHPPPASEVVLTKASCQGGRLDAVP